MGSAFSTGAPRGPGARAGPGRGRGEQRGTRPHRWESVFEGGVAKCVGEPGVSGSGEPGRLVRSGGTVRAHQEDNQLPLLSIKFYVTVVMWMHFSFNVL